MLLRAKVVLILSAVVAAYAVIDHVAQRVLIAPSFESLEREEAREDLQRAMEAVTGEIEHLDATCADWATGDDTYRFAADANPEFAASKLSRATALGLRLDLLFVCRPGGEVAWADIHERGSSEQLQLRGLFPRGAFSPSHPLLAENTQAGRERGPEHGRARGLVMTERGPMLVASRPILASSGTGPARGTLVMGRFLDQATLADLERRASVRFTVWPLDDTGRPPEARIPERERALLDEITSAPDPVVSTRDERSVDVYGTFPDIQAAPALLVRATVDRAISARGATAIRYSLVSTAAAGLLLLLVLLGLLQRTVIEPITLLTRHAVTMGRSEHATERLRLARQDEVGILSREFDDMLDKLAESRAAVVEVARAAGKSEIATGILHNVGNVLNTVNVSAALVADRVRNSRLPKLQRLAGVAEEHGERLGQFLAEDPKGKHFAPYLGELARLMALDQQTIVREVDTLNAGIEHIRRLVDSQQAYARRSELREPTSIARLVEDALRISEQALVDCRATEVVTRFEELAPVPVDKHKVLEILVNLCKNARESMQRFGIETPRLTVAVRRANEDRVVVEIADNGEGIAPEALVRIFQHGFTTHREGHGFGLHGAANSATEMGGRLFARSDGPGRGATFTLELPLEPSDED